MVQGHAIYVHITSHNTCVSRLEKKNAEWERAVRTSRKKLRRAVICPLIVIYCDSRATRADSRTFACEIGDGIRAWISSRTAERMSRTRAENVACLTQLYVGRWSGIGRLSVLARWHVSFIPHHVHGRSAARASERAACGKKKETRGSASLFPFILPSAVLHVTRSQERGKLNMSVAMEYRSEARPRACRRERNSSSRISSMRWKINSSLIKQYNDITIRRYI